MTRNFGWHDNRSGSFGLMLGLMAKGHQAYKGMTEYWTKASMLSKSVQNQRSTRPRILFPLPITDNVGESHMKLYSFISFNLLNH